jgi:CBS domain-containing protein
MTPMPHTIGVDQPVATAQRLMHDHQTRHLPVLDDGHLVGMVSERDLRLARPGEETLPVSEVMHDEAYAVSGRQPLAQVARHLAKHKLGSAVVTENDRVIGIVTVVDVARALADLLDADR